MSLLDHKTRVLHVIGAMNRGGAESLVMFIFRKIDLSKFSFDFLVNDKGSYDDEIRSLGGELHYIPRFVGTNFIEYIRALMIFFRKHHDYDVVHVHIGSTACFVIPVAHKYGIYSIAHSHNTNGELSPSELAFRMVSYPTRFLADYYLACSAEAGQDRFGKSVSKSARFSVLRNGIDAETYRFDEEIREQYRNELGIDPSTKALCHIGRFTEQKNHAFLLEAFQRSLVDNQDQVLFLIGTGELLDEVKAYAIQLGISDKVIFLGVRPDINQLLMAMDLFVFPSKWEGLGIVAIEAQASGLPCLLSPKLPDISVCAPYAIKLPDIDNPSEWAERINATAVRDLDERAEGVQYVTRAGFDISDTVGFLSELYTVRP